MGFPLQDSLHSLGCQMDWKGIRKDLLLEYLPSLEHDEQEAWVQALEQDSDLNFARYCCHPLSPLSGLPNGLEGDPKG